MERLEATRFTIDGEIYVTGVHDKSQRWNGWATPKFTQDAIVKWLEATRQAEIACGFEDVLRFEANEDVIFVSQNGEFEYAVYHVDDDGMYSVGAFEWCWMEMEADA